MQRHTIKTVADLEQVLAKQQPRPDERLGDILFREKLVTTGQLAEALAMQRKEPQKHLGRFLIEMGVVTPEQVHIALAEKFGVPYVRLDEFQIDQHVLSLIPADVALHYNILPLAQVGGHLYLAAANPLDWEAMDVVRFHANCHVDIVLASLEDISRVLDHNYTRFDESELLEELAVAPVARASQAAARAELHTAEREAMKKPVVRLLNSVLLQAISRQASDIHIRPEKDRMTIYYRIDGVLQFIRTLHKSLLLPLVSRIKILGQMDISERRLPQDGHTRLMRPQGYIDFRLSTIPTIHGESVVIRILNKEVGVKPLDKLGLRSDELQQLRRLMDKTTGIFLVTGPTGSGKSTTLYAVINEVRKRNPHIITVEDPVEYDIEGVEQIQVIPGINYTFAEALRHILRHDPDVVMVGEIRDLETARIANKAALTGHLVLSTLHTNDAASAVTRLVDMGIEPYLLGSTLLGVMAQRLVRIVCPHCKVAEAPDPRLCEHYQTVDKDVFYRGKGCAACGHTGYHGRTMVCELLPVTPEIAELVRNGKDAAAIRQLALAQGMRTITQNTLHLARQGLTSLQEVYALGLE